MLPDYHAATCPPESYTATSCTCGFVARFLSTPRPPAEPMGVDGPYLVLPPPRVECFFCHGPAHPSTGCAYSPRVLACHACTVAFWRWFRAHQNARGRPGRDKRGRMMADFYEAAGKEARDR